MSDDPDFIRRDDDPTNRILAWNNCRACGEHVYLRERDPEAKAFAHGEQILRRCQKCGNEWTTHAEWS